MTESNFLAMHVAIENEVNILKDKCGALSVEIEQTRLEVHINLENTSLSLNQAMQQVSLDIAQVRQSTRATGETGCALP